MKKNLQIGGRGYQISSDDDYLKSMDGTFEPHMVQLFRTLIKPTDLVADIGANIGLTALLFSTLAERVLAFEPSSSTFKLLQENLSDANVHNVDAFNIGFGQRTENLTITFAANNRSGGYVSEKIRPERGHVTENISIDVLDEFFAQGRRAPDFLKIDVEGFEQNVIRGGEKLLLESKPMVVLEMNHFCLDVLQRITVPDFLDYLRSIFPQVYAVDKDNSVIADIHDPDQAYFVMHEHVVHQRFPNLVAGFSDELKEKLDRLVAVGKKDAALRSFQTPRVENPIGRIAETSVPNKIVSGGAFEAEVEVTNGSETDWIGYGIHPVRLCYHWKDEDGRYVIYDGERSSFSAQVVRAGSSTTSTVHVVAPAEEGQFTLVLTVVQEGVGWFEDSGFETASVAVTVI